ncbi:MAG: terpene cyclase/mutase family protein [Planctomycetes bacterium]|nr:terpene cyclase/mutase family protein [Planctomycetota bacterium]
MMRPQDIESVGEAHWQPPQADFNEVLYEQLKKTPWFMISLVIHLVAFLVLGNLSFADIVSDPAEKVTAKLDREQPDELIDEPEPEIEQEEPEDVPLPEPEVEPVTEDVQPAENESEEDSPMDQPYEGKQTNAVLGLGGSVGGGFGGRPNRGPDRFVRIGGESTAQTVDRGLEWLARHQTPEEGCWDADGFQEQCQERGSICEGRGYPLYDPGVTGLALLAFLGAGYTHQVGQYRKTLGDAIKYLRRIQDPEGCFGIQTGHFMYSHACCTLAMAEAYGMTGSPLLRPAVEKGLGFLYKAQNPNPSGTGKLAWRYTVQPGDNDTSVTGWVVMALKSARMAGFDVPQSTLEGARVWLDQMTDPATGRCGYVQAGVSPVRAPGREDKWPRSRSEAITAVAMLTRVFLDEDPAKSRPIQQGTKLCLERLPNWNEGDGSIDQYYWYYGTLAMFQVGGPPWQKWNRAMKAAIIDHQRKDGCEKGSWDPVGPWGEDGGRVYATAILTMCLEVYYRYGKVFGAK